MQASTWNAARQGPDVQPPLGFAAALGETAIALNNITVRFGAYTAIRNVNLHVRENELVAVVGPTGCGKSTILNVVTGLLQPSGGHVTVFGERLRGLNNASGYMLQQDGLLPWKTVEDNVALGLIFQGRAAREAREKARAWIERVGLKGFETRYPNNLSGGQKKRVAMAQTLIVEPRVVLMDEPFSALDVHTRRLMHRVLLNLWQQERRSLIFITHDLEEAITLADRVVIMSAGPESNVVGEVPITLARPRTGVELATSDEFVRLYRQVWDLLGAEVEKSYATQN